MDVSSLKPLRLAWYEAYFAGDIKQLQQIEADGFTYICAEGIQTCPGRYEQIARRKDQGQWFPVGGRRDEQQVHYQALHKACHVTGLATITAGAVQHQRYFSELWIRQPAWQIISLHASVRAESLL